VETNGVKMSANPFDDIALEEALRMKAKGIATEVIVVSIGDKKCQDTLRTSLAMGADRAILVETDGQTQPLAVAKLLKAVVAKEGAGLVVLGKQAIDGDNGQTGGMLAGLLAWPQALCASKVEVAADKSSLAVTREIDGGLETLHVPLPAVLTADLRLNEPRYVTLPNIMQAKKKPLETTTPAALGVDAAATHKVVRVEEPPARKGGATVPDVDSLVAALRKTGLVK
jgi:electron transfer flavoprotein beta subunit